MIRRRVCLPLAFLLGAACAAWADPAEELIDLFRASLGAPHPMTAFYRGLADLDDMDLDRGELTRILDEAEVPDEELAEVLHGLSRFEKSGSLLRVTRDDAITVSTDEGAMRLDEVVEAKVVFLSNGDVRLEKVRGVSAGQSRFWLFPLRSVTYTMKNGEPVARMKVGYFPWITTVTLPIETGASAGLAGSLPN